MPQLHSHTSSMTQTPEPPMGRPLKKKHSRIPSVDAIAELAYEKYLARGCVDGRDLDDWLAAERELTGA